MVVFFSCAVVVILNYDKRNFYYAVVVILNYERRRNFELRIRDFELREEANDSLQIIIFISFTGG